MPAEPTPADDEPADEPPADEPPADEPAKPTKSDKSGLPTVTDEDEE